MKKKNSIGCCPCDHCPDTVSITVTSCGDGASSSWDYTYELIQAGVVVQSFVGQGTVTWTIAANSGSYTVQVTNAVGVVQTGSFTASDNLCVHHNFNFHFTNNITIDNHCCPNVGSGGQMDADTVVITVGGVDRSTWITLTPPGHYVWTPLVDIGTDAVSIAVTYKGRTQTVDFVYGTCAYDVFWVTMIGAQFFDVCWGGVEGGVDAEIAGMSVQFSIASGIIGTATTDATGTATVEPSIGVIPGDAVTITPTLAGYDTGPFVMTLSLLEPQFLPGTHFPDYGYCSAYFNEGVTYSLDPATGEFHIWVFVLSPDATHCCPPCNYDGTAPAGTVIPQNTLTVNDGIADIIMEFIQCDEWTGCALRLAANASHTVIDPVTHVATTTYYTSVNVPVYFRVIGQNLFLAIAADGLDTGANDYPYYTPDMACGTVTWIDPDHVYLDGIGIGDYPNPLQPSPSGEPIAAATCVPLAFSQNIAFGGGAFSQIYGPIGSFTVTLA